MRRFLNDFFRYIIYHAGYRGMRRYVGWFGMVVIGIVGIMFTQGISLQEGWQYLMESMLNAWHWVQMHLGFLVID